MRLTCIAFAHYALVLGAAASTSLATADELSSTPASASPQTAAAVASEHPVNSATRNWLSLQSSNTSAAPARPGGGEEASLVYHRYLESFKRAIPTFFASSTGKGNGAVSGASN